MGQVEKTIEIYDNTGLIEVKTVLVDEIPLEEQIKSKEEELLRMYKELERLKELNNL